jgi:hypothetical protein
MEQPDSKSARHGPRVKHIDWQRVKQEVDALSDGECVMIADVDQSMRTHIRRGRFAYIDPSEYEVWTEGINGSRTRANLFMRRKQ